MVLTMEEPTEAMALPVTAVVGSEGQGQVVVVDEDGATSIRPVELGISDIFWIEVTGGLEEGDQVLEFPTQFDFGPGSA
jgi:multidrug efflux pump subunit AcrA (membrane-fusion protein)